MPSISKAQAAAMRAAATGKSTLGIPKSVGQEFAAADKASDSPLPWHVQAQHGHRAKGRHRAGKGRNKGRPVDHMAEANKHLKNAHAAPTKQETHAHLFKALSSLKKAT